ncbi:MAG: hypothetical protein CLLPBCKN_008429 [Chroococcidiopsis cubana SAG 39.79]|uniref:Uncharacterized protein n=1 Tax=Chroococcidiopsis cubana SAG 39.79 TaxID=388085 RepID=A0AB37U7T4_9CYAN|nr:hypothetical protein [Chroococcidiopsis cubana]MDZ4878991.1 hypothetical protein [Chroococcidiopsis cubana SAG 39.79]PSB60319.1 hypothetical protein C7B79_26195 [Chroococcidiopsis cubana CCALA 043]RUS95845.1 hypothetical protein DSM107010_71130 [Chroococcidiopsis cubana SAG 39.79]
MIQITIAQSIEALEVAVNNNDPIEFGIVLARLHERPQTQKERTEIVDQLDFLMDKYPFFNWQDSLRETEPAPQWILSSLPTQHQIKLSAGLYQKLNKFFQHSRAPRKTSAKQVEILMDELINQLLQDFLQARQEV